MHHSGGGREGHRRIDRAATDRDEARARAEVGQDHAAVGGLAGDAAQLAEQVLVGQTVKSEPAIPRVDVRPRDRKKLRYPRQVAMKRRVETDHLRHSRPGTPEHFDHGDLLRKVCQIERPVSPELVEDGRR